MLGAAYLAAVAVPSASAGFAWLPRIGLAAYASVTIVAYLAMGPYFALGWLTKGVELAIVMLVIADLLHRDRCGPRSAPAADERLRWQPA